MSMVGLPYIWGGDDPIKGFDCSGLVIEILKADGYLPHKFDTTAQGLYDLFKAEYYPEKAVALAFYGKSKEKITHVGYCLDGLKILEAGGGGSSTNDLETAAKQNAYIRVRPISYRNDFISFGIPYKIT